MCPLVFGNRTNGVTYKYSTQSLVCQLGYATSEGMHNMQERTHHTLAEYFNSEEYKAMKREQDAFFKSRGLNKLQRNYVHMKVRLDLYDKLMRYKYVVIEGYGVISEEEHAN